MYLYPDEMTYLAALARGDGREDLATRLDLLVGQAVARHGERASISVDASAAVGYALPKVRA